MHLHILPSKLWGHVAGSGSVSEVCEKGEVTSGFLCEDGQVHGFEGGGGVCWGSDFLHECLAGKCLKLDLLSQGPLWEVTTHHPACMPYSFSNSSVSLHTFRVSVMGEREQKRYKKKKTFKR